MDLPPMPDEHEMPEKKPDGEMPGEMPEEEKPHGMPPMMASTTAPVNVVLTFRNTDITGVISASTAKHLAPTLTPDTRELLSEVTNQVSPVVNNGVIVTLEGRSSWTVTGTSYLSSLSIDTDARVIGEMMIDGMSVPLEPGTYRGNILVMARKDMA